MKLRDCIVAFITAIIIIVVYDLAEWDKLDAIIIWLVFLMFRDETKIYYCKLIKDEK